MAVFKELRKIDPSLELTFWCDRKFGPTARTMFASYDSTIPVEMIFSGKFRRYHSLSKWYALHPGILFPNVIDMFKVFVGFVQSFFKLLSSRPDVIFMKGGFVCLPVGYAARVLLIPIVIHDSDAHPGLTNRLLAPFAKMIGTGAPLEYYNYPKGKSRYVGIPIDEKFRVYSEDERKLLKQSLGFDASRPLLVVTGGGLGASRINDAVIESLDTLLKVTSVFLISGKGDYDRLVGSVGRSEVLRIEPFISSGMAEVLAAADIVVARAGATTLLELAALAKPTIIIPNARLTAGHQVKNAKVYQDSFAAIVMKEEELDTAGALSQKVRDMLMAPNILNDLGTNFAKFAKPAAAKDMAQMVLECANRAGRSR